MGMRSPDNFWEMGPVKACSSPGSFQGFCFSSFYSKLQRVAYTLFSWVIQGRVDEVPESLKSVICCGGLPEILDERPDQAPGYRHVNRPLIMAMAKVDTSLIQLKAKETEGEHLYAVIKVYCGYQPMVYGLWSMVHGLF